MAGEAKATPSPGSWAESKNAQAVPTHCLGTRGLVLPLLMDTDKVQGKFSRQVTSVAKKRADMGRLPTEDKNAALQGSLGGQGHGQCCSINKVCILLACQCLGSCTPELGSRRSQRPILQPK